MDEEQRQILERIMTDFNAIGAKAMMELSNGKDQFTISRGAWTVSLDVERFINQLNESRERMEKMAPIIDEASQKWQEHLEKIRKHKSEKENDNGKVE